MNPLDVLLWPIAPYMKLVNNIKIVSKMEFRCLLGQNIWVSSIILKLSFKKGKFEEYIYNKRIYWVGLGIFEH